MDAACTSHLRLVSFRDVPHRVIGVELIPPFVQREQVSRGQVGFPRLSRDGFPRCANCV